MKITIRSEERKDLEQVRAILRDSFPTDAESRLVDALRENGRAVISLVAVNDEEVLGHILFSPVTTSPPESIQGLGLAPVAVRRDVRAQGIASELIREGLRLCRELRFEYCVVLGSPEFYGRFGFERASLSRVENEYGADAEFMLLRFTAGQVNGLVQYAPEFRRFSV